MGFFNPRTREGYIARIDGYHQVGNQAQFSGRIVWGSVGELRIRVIALDVAKGGVGDMIRITRRPIEYPPFVCSRPNTASRPVVRGDIAVLGQTAVTTASAPVAPVVGTGDRPGDTDL